MPGGFDFKLTGGVGEIRHTAGNSWLTLLSLIAEEVVNVHPWSFWI